MNVLDFITTKEKLTIIVNLTFSINLKELETYLNLTKYLRVYVSRYARVFESFQNRKTLLFKNDLIKRKFRKIFARKRLLEQLTKVEIRLYEHLKSIFSKKSFLRHLDLLWKLFIDVDTSKKWDVRTMIFHVKEDSKKEIIFKRSDIELIMFLSKILIFVETKYWLIELKMIEVVWIVKKIRYLIKNSRKSLKIIFIDHSTIAEIIKQISLTFSNTNKLNLRLVKASQYLFALFIEIRVKLEKFHVISNALFRLFFIMNKNKLTKNENVLKDLQFDFDVLLVQLISEIKTFFFDTKSSHIHQYLDVYFDQDEFLIKMTKNFRNTLL
jgi:hypothetical protein